MEEMSHSCLVRSSLSLYHILFTSSYSQAFLTTVQACLGDIIKIKWEFTARILKYSWLEA